MMMKYKWAGAVWGLPYCDGKEFRYNNDSSLNAYQHANKWFCSVHTLKGERLKGAVFNIPSNIPLRAGVQWKWGCLFLFRFGGSLGVRSVFDDCVTIFV